MGQCSTGTKGARRLSTLHPNTILNPNPDPNTHPNPKPSLNPTPAAAPNPNPTPRLGLVLGAKMEGLGACASCSIGISTTVLVHIRRVIPLVAVLSPVQPFRWTVGPSPDPRSNGGHQPRHNTVMRSLVIPLGPSSLLTPHIRPEHATKPPFSHGPHCLGTDNAYNFLLNTQTRAYNRT